MGNFSNPIAPAANGVGKIVETRVNFDGRDAVLFGYEGDYFFDNVNTHLHAAVTVIDELRKLPPGAVICDVGANIGTTALVAAFIVPDSTILSFEPSPRARACLAKMVEANSLGNIEVIPAAVGARRGRTLMAETQFLAGSHLVSGQSPTRDQATAQVDVVTLDDILLASRKLDRLDLLKIDVEGFELDVLEGAMRTIEKYRPRLVVEFSAFGVVANADGSPLRLLERLIEIAGVLSVQMPWGMLDVTPDPQSIKDFLYANMRIGAQDIAMSVRPGFAAPKRPSRWHPSQWLRSGNA